MFFNTVNILNVDVALYIANIVHGYSNL